MNGFNVAAKWALVGVLLCGSIAPVWADEQPVLPAITWKGPPGDGTSFATPQAAFARYQHWLVEQGITTWTVVDVRVCAGNDLPEQPGFLSRHNGIDVFYCWTIRNSDGSSDIPAGMIQMEERCPLEKPTVLFKPRIPLPQPPNVSDFLVFCTGAEPRPEPTPPKLTPSCCGNPIAVESQTKIEHASDIALDGLLRFERTYTSNTGEWRHTFSDTARNLTLNAIPQGPSPACYPGTVIISGVKRRRCLPYASNFDLQRTNAGDWLVQRAEGRAVTFDSSTGISNSLGTHEKAHQILDNAGQYAGLVIQTENRTVEKFDSGGRLVSRLRLNGSGVVLTYLGPAGEKLPASAPSCAGLTVGTLKPGSPSCATDTITGRQLLFSYNVEGNLGSVTDPSGAIITYQYDGPSATGSMEDFHALTSVTYPDTAQRTYHYNESSLTSGADLPSTLTGITDERGIRYTFFGYDTFGRAKPTAHANGAGSFSISGSTVTDPLGTQRNYLSVAPTSVASDNTIASRVVAPTGQIVPSVSGGTVRSTIEHDTRSNIKSIRDLKGNLTTFQYDPVRQVETQRVEASGTARARTISTRWHPDWLLRSQVAEPKRMTWFIYNGQPDPTNGNDIATCAPAGALIDAKPIAVLCKEVSQSTTDANGSSGFTATLAGNPRVRTFSYNADGQPSTVDGPRNDVVDTTAYAYYTADDSAVPKSYRRGDLQTVTNAVGQVTTFNTYNAFGQPLTITDSNGVVTTLSYDARARLTSRTVGTEATALEYWPTGLLKKVTLPDSSFVSYTYDDAHRLIRIDDGAGNRVEYALDGLGNHTAENVYDPSNALARTRSQVFDTLGRLWKEVTAGGIVAVEHLYDNNGNELNNKAALGRNTTNQYDELDRLRSITDPRSGATVLAYDAADNLTSVTDPRNLVTSYAINGLGDRTQQVSPDTGTLVSTYDETGNLRTRTDARSKVGTYSYDALDRVTSIAFADLTTSFTYDAGTNGKGRLTGASDANHSLSFGYDAQGRVTSKVQTVGSVTKSVGYGFTNGNLTSLTTPSGQSIGYAYTEGRITGITLNGSTTILDQVLYDPFGPASGWRWGNGTFAARVYDADGNPTTIDSAGASDYGYDDAFRVTSITDLNDGTKSWTFGYDALDRLNAATGSAQTIGYTYDANGNRLTQTGTQAATYSISPTNNRISSITGSPARTYSYDAAGNTTGDGTNTYAYNDAGRLSSVTRGGVTTTYVYNALGQRARKSNSSSTRVFAYDEAGHLLGEYDASGALVQETVWLGDTPVATLRPNGGGVSVFYIHADHLNTPRRISRPSDNAIVWRWDSDAFGTNAPSQDPDGDASTFVYNPRFPGQYFDAESGISYNYFRDYDPAIGRYVESDPIGLDGGINTYAYANQNPLNSSDANGLNPATAGRVGWVLGRVGGLVLDRILIGAIGTSLGGVIYEACHDEDYGFSEPMEVKLPLDVGGEAWGRRKGVGAAEGRRRAHNVKKDDNGRATDKYTVDPATGEVYDPNGDSVGNLNDEPGS